MESLDAKGMRNKSLRGAKEVIRRKMEEATAVGSTSTRIYVQRDGLFIDMPKILKKCITSLEENNHVVTSNITSLDDGVPSFGYIDVKLEKSSKINLLSKMKY